jgi:hypothetical protein
MQTVNMNNTTLEDCEATEASPVAPEITPSSEPRDAAESLPGNPPQDRSPRVVKWLLFPLAAVAVCLMIKVALLLNDLSSILNRDFAGMHFT